jgi:hypothetical protein
MLLSKELVMATTLDVDQDSAIATTLWQKLVERIRHNHGLMDDLHLLIGPKGDVLIDEFTKVLVSAGAKERQSYFVPVSYDAPHLEQIRAAGFGWVSNYDRNLIRNSPNEHCCQVPQGSIGMQLMLIHFDTCTTTEYVLNEMKGKGLRPALAVETMAFAKAHPDVQREFPIIGFGSLWVDSKGDQQGLCLFERNEERLLGLMCFDGVWNSGFRFLAART